MPDIKIVPPYKVFLQTLFYPKKLIVHECFYRRLIGDSLEHDERVDPPGLFSLTWKRWTLFSIPSRGISTFKKNIFKELTLNDKILGGEEYVHDFKPILF